MLLRLRSLTLVLLLLMQLVQLVVSLILPPLNLALVLSSVLFWPIEQSSEGWKIILYMGFPSQFAPCLVSCWWSSSGSLTSRLLCCSSLRFSVMVPLWQYQRTGWNHLLYQTVRSWLRFFYNWHCSWQLLGNDDSHFLLGCIQNRFLPVGISCVNHWENNSWGLLKACVCNIPASEHCQSGSHICDPILKLVLCWASWLVAHGGFLGCSAGCYFDCSPC